MLRFPSPNRPIFEKGQKVKKKIPESLVKKQILKFTGTPTPIVLNYRYFVFLACLDIR